MESLPPVEEQARSEVIDEANIKSESVPPTEAPLSQTLFESVPPTVDSPLEPSNSQPIPSTETETDPSTAMAGAPKALKKGSASVAKKTPKRPKNGPSGHKKAKKPKTDSQDPSLSEPTDGIASEDDESDHGPYCLCRGPDDHRWMICCEKCEDWFHGECINLSKEIGESLIEKFICPNCTVGKVTSIYKKTCALGACRKAARMTDMERSVFCSDEHAQMWWERMVSRLPKQKGKAGLSDHLAQDEFMALLGSGLAKIDEDGSFKMATLPFSGPLPKLQNGDGDASPDGMDHILTREEKDFVDGAAATRYNLAEETLLCHKMLTLIELAQERRKAAIAAGRIDKNDGCGYDPRLDTISACDAFAAFVKSPEGQSTFEAAKLDDPPEGMYDRGMCERKRCKVHGGWQKMLVLGIKHQIREMAGQAAEVEEEERIVKEAAGERWRRKRAESNWVEMIEG